MRSRASSHRGERAEDTSSASSLVEVELVERNGHSGEDAVARYKIGLEPRKFEFFFDQGSGIICCMGTRLKVWSLQCEVVFGVTRCFLPARWISAHMLVL